MFIVCIVSLLFVEKVNKQWSVSISPWKLSDFNFVIRKGVVFFVRVRIKEKSFKEKYSSKSSKKLSQSPPGVRKSMTLMSSMCIITTVWCGFGGEAFDQSPNKLQKIGSNRDSALKFRTVSQIAAPHDALHESDQNDCSGKICIRRWSCGIRCS